MYVFSDQVNSLKLILSSAIRFPNNTTVVQWNMMCCHFLSAMLPSGGDVKRGKCKKNLIQNLGQSKSLCMLPYPPVCIANRWQLKCTGQFEA